MTRFGLFIALAGAVCLVAFRYVGTTVDQNGLLHEPFALLPIGYSLLFLGACLVVYGLVKSARIRQAKKH